MAGTWEIVFGADMGVEVIEPFEFLGMVPVEGGVVGDVNIDCNAAFFVCAGDLSTTITITQDEGPATAVITQQVLNNDGELVEIEVSSSFAGGAVDPSVHTSHLAEEEGTERRVLIEWTYWFEDEDPFLVAVEPREQDLLSGTLVLETHDVFGQDLRVEVGFTGRRQ